MDIYEYLEKDHQKVSDLFKQFEETESPLRKKEIIAFLGKELYAHAKSEQMTFYKVLEAHENSHEEAQHGKKEHKEIEMQLDKVLGFRDSGTHWQKEVIKLKELVEHHVKEEEGTMFKKAKEILSEEDSFILKEKMHYTKPRFYKTFMNGSSHEKAKKEV